MRKPNFLVIGASRSGTTYIRDNIDCHPEIYVVNEPAEPHFFNKNYEKGIDYYQSLFSSARDEKAVGEVTPDYIFNVPAAQRIKENYPEIKLIASLRNPVDRLYSMYWILRDKNEKYQDYSFEELLDERPELIEQGFYVDHLKKYLENFRKDQIKIVLFERIVNEPKEFLKEIYNFLGVDANFLSPHSNSRINRSGYLKHDSRFKYLFYLWRISKKLKLKKTAYKLEKLNSKPVPEMKAETRRKLQEIYSPKNAELQQVFGLNLSSWTN